MVSSSYDKEQSSENKQKSPQKDVSPSAGNNKGHPTHDTELAQAVGRLGNSRLSYLVGTAILFLSLVAFVFAWKWDGHFYDRRGCSKIEVVQQRIFKVNSCDGTWEEIFPTSSENSPSSQNSK
jgi:hypothetical protein